VFSGPGPGPGSDQVLDNTDPLGDSTQDSSHFFSVGFHTLAYWPRTIAPPKITPSMHGWTQPGSGQGGHGAFAAEVGMRTGLADLLVRQVKCPPRRFPEL